MKQSVNFRNRSYSHYIYFLLFIILPITSAISQDVTKLIPSSSYGVFTFDAGSFFKKIDLQQIQRLDMFQDLDEQNQLRNGNKHKHMSKIYKAPESVGLNVNSKWYVFMDHSEDTTLWGTRPSFYGLLIPLSKSSKFENFYKKLSDSTIIKRKGYKYSMLGSSQLIAWNKSHLILLFTSSYSDDAVLSLTKELDKITHLNGEQCLKNNKNFCEAQTDKFDFHYWMHYGKLFSGMNLTRYAFMIPGLKNMPFANENFYKDNYLQISLSFDNGAIHMNAKQFLSKESAKQVDNLYGKGINKDLLKYIHKDHLLGAYSFSANMKGIKSMIDTMATDTLKNKMNKEFVELFYSDYLKKDKQLSKLNKDLDSMYADLYPSREDDTNSYNYNNYQYDTTAYSSDYNDTTTYNYQYEEDTTTLVAPYEEPMNIDTTESSYDTNYSYDTTNYKSDNYYYNKTDSIYNAKNARIKDKNKEVKERRSILIKKKVQELNIQKDDILELFKGDFLMAFTGYHFVSKKYKSYEYDENEYKTVEVEKVKNDPFPEFTIVLTVNNKTKLQSLFQGFVKDSILNKEKTYYYLQEKEDSTLRFYLALSDDLLIVSTEIEMVTKNINGFAAENIISKEIEDLMLNKIFSVYVSLKDIFASLPYSMMTTQKAELYTLLMNSFTNSYLTTENLKPETSNSEFVFNFTNKLDNSLFEILRLINEGYKINKSSR